MTQKEQIQYLARVLLHLSTWGSIPQEMTPKLSEIAHGTISGHDLMKKKFKPLKRKAKSQ